MSLRFKIVCGAALTIALLFFIGVIATSNGASVFASKPQKNMQVTPNPGAPDHGTYAPGAPAIAAHLTANTANGASTPAFTKDDVTTYFNTHGFFAGPLVKVAHLQILTIQFVTAKEASNLMKGESADRPDDYLVCYVKVKGPFEPQHVEAPHGAKLSPTNFGEAVFDAHTGNLLVWGVF